VLASGVGNYGPSPAQAATESAEASKTRRFVKVNMMRERVRVWWKCMSGRGMKGIMVVGRTAYILGGKSVIDRYPPNSHCELSWADVSHRVPHTTHQLTFWKMGSTAETPRAMWNTRRLSTSWRSGIPLCGRCNEGSRSRYPPSKVPLQLPANTSPSSIMQRVLSRTSGA